jgi:acetylornithine deacetylase/succinyl-diaminopimelate desuccinylase-like protein
MIAPTVDSRKPIAESHEPMHVIELTERLVAAPSYDGVGEAAAAEVARAAMVALGYRDVAVDHAGNVTGRMPGTGQRPGIVVFDGHLDTVGVGSGGLGGDPLVTGGWSGCTGGARPT